MPKLPPDELNLHMKDVEKKSLGDKYFTHMKDKNQPDISNSTQKLPWYKTPAGKAYNKAYRQSPEYKAKRKAYYQSPEYKSHIKAPDSYYQSSEYKAIRKAYYQSPEYRAKQKAYRQSPEFKANQKVCRQTPEYKAKQTLKQTPEYKARRKEIDRAWKKANPKKVLATNKASHEKRLKKDPLYASKCILRRAVLHTFRRIGKNKPADTQTLLGCDSETAKAHIESLFKEGMTWDNHGVYGWHIDHIRPVSSFTEEDLHLMNHISNLQPLWAEENLEKSNKIP